MSDKQEFEGEQAQMPELPESQRWFVSVKAYPESAVHNFVSPFSLRSVYVSLQKWETVTETVETPKGWGFKRKTKKTVTETRWVDHDSDTVVNGSDEFTPAQLRRAALNILEQIRKREIRESLMGAYPPKTLPVEPDKSAQRLWWTKGEGKKMEYTAVTRELEDLLNLLPKEDSTARNLVMTKLNLMYNKMDELS